MDIDFNPTRASYGFNLSTRIECVAIQRFSVLGSSWNDTSFRSRASTNRASLKLIDHAHASVTASYHLSFYRLLAMLSITAQGSSICGAVCFFFSRALGVTSPSPWNSSVISPFVAHDRQRACAFHIARVRRTINTDTYTYTHERYCRGLVNMWGMSVHCAGSQRRYV